MSDNLLRFIPADMLEYSSALNRYTLYTDEQIETMISNCRKAGLEDPEDIELYILEVSYQKIVGLLFQRVVDGFVSVEYDEATEKLNFEPINHE